MKLCLLVIGGGGNTLSFASTKKNRTNFFSYQLLLQVQRFLRATNKARKLLEESGPCVGGGNDRRSRHNTESQAVVHDNSLLLPGTVVCFFLKQKLVNKQTNNVLVQKPTKY